MILSHKKLLGKVLKKTLFAINAIVTKDSIDSEYGLF